MEITFFLSIQKGGYPDLLATSGDYLRVWRVSENESRLECLLNNVSPGQSKKHFREEIKHFLLRFVAPTTLTSYILSCNNEKVLKMP